MTNIQDCTYFRVVLLQRASMFLPDRDVYIGVDGLVMDGRLYYWSSPFMSLMGVSLRPSEEGPVLHLDLAREYGRGLRTFALDLAVPRGREQEAGEVVGQLLERNMIPEDDSR